MENMFDLDDPNKNETMSPKQGADASTAQLNIRYRRYQEQISTIRELLLKVSISVERLEAENNSLREQNEYLLQKSGYRGNKATEMRPAKGPSAAKTAVNLTLATVDKMQAKMVDFEKVALSERTSTVQTKQENRQIKAAFEEVQRNLEQEKKKNDVLQEKQTFLENKLVKEATLKLAVERRYHSLRKEILELTHELSAQCSQTTERTSNRQQLSTGSDADQSPVSNVAITRTPREASSKPTADRYFSTTTTFKQTTPIHTRRFQKVLSGVGEKLKTFFSTEKTFQTVHKVLVEHTKDIFKWDLQK